MYFSESNESGLAQSKVEIEKVQADKAAEVCVFVFVKKLYTMNVHLCFRLYTILVIKLVQL